jgi:hypothetical protein
MVRQSHGVDVGGESGTLGWKKLLTRHCTKELVLEEAPH